MNDALVNFRDLVVHNIEHCDGEDLVIPEELCIDLMTTIIRLRDLAKPKFLNEPVTSLEHKSILTEAEGLVHGDRNESYGHPLDDFNRTAKMWSAILGIDVKPDQVGLCMIAVKLSRECHRPKRDNLVDIAGYAETVEWAKDEQHRREVLTETFSPIETA